MLPIFGLCFHSFAMKDVDHHAFTTGRISRLLFVEMSLMTAATAERDFVHDDNKNFATILSIST